MWESGKEYVVTGDVTVEAGATLTIQPEVVVKLAHERADEYYGITVKGTLMADGGDSTTAISDSDEWCDLFHRPDQTEEKERPRCRSLKR